MKKYILVLVVSLFTLSGCSFSASIGEETETEKKSEIETECVFESDIKETVITSISKDNIIITETYVTKDDFSSYDDKDSIVEDIEEQFEEYEVLFDVDGVEYDYKIKNYISTETVKVTYAELNVKDGLDLGLLNGVDPDETNYEAKLDKSTESREQQGFTCKDK